MEEGEKKVMETENVGAVRTSGQTGAASDAKGRDGIC